MSLAISISALYISLMRSVNGAKYLNSTFVLLLTTSAANSMTV